MDDNVDGDAAGFRPQSISSGYFFCNERRKRNVIAILTNDGQLAVVGS